MLSCSVWFSAPSFWMGGGLESRCVGRVYGADGTACTIQNKIQKLESDLLKPYFKKSPFLTHAANNV